MLIAGTYTPFCLVALAAVWGLAPGGIGLRLRWMHAPTWLATALYVALGWIALLALPALLRALPGGALAGAAAGAVVYALERPPWRWGPVGAHELWHLLVLGGSACHVWAIARYLPALD